MATTQHGHHHEPDVRAAAAVTAHNLSVTIDRSVLLAPTSFTLHPGRALAVTGSNGSGKTTLLRAIAGTIAPSTGSVQVGGGPPDDRDPGFRARLAALLGLPPLARSLTLHEHMVLVATSWGQEVAQAQDRAQDLLSSFGIARLAARFPHELSSGQTQLFTLALTLTRPFEVLLLDEPEQRLDADRLAMVGQILRAQVQRGTAILLASHSPALVEQVTDDVLVLTEDVDDAGH